LNYEDEARTSTSSIEMSLGNKPKKSIAVSKQETHLKSITNIMKKMEGMHCMKVDT